MAQSILQGRKVSERIRGSALGRDVSERLVATPTEKFPLPKRIPAGNDFTEAGMEARLTFLENELGMDASALRGDSGIPEAKSLRGNIENLAGFVKIPLGVIGPLRINGIHAHGDYYVPLATTEGALVASCHRGAYVISLAGGVSAMCLSESVSRAPGFVFDSLREAALFMDWVLKAADQFPRLVAESTSHGKLQDIKLSSCGTLVYLIFEFTTGDAAGQNMVTVATDRVCRHIIESSPVKPTRWYIEANLSGDKKASMLSFQGTRGKKVIAAASIPAALTKRFLHATPSEMVEYWRISALGGVQSGTIGIHGHYANALTGIFLACGQDVACVAEAAIGVTQMTVSKDDALEVSVSLPNLVVGTVGGGTHLPSALTCLEMLGCTGTGKARAFAEICAATVLAGETSIIAAMASDDFTRAHSRFRGKPKQQS